LGQPVLYGTVILNDGKTGKPLAIFNGAKLTAVRTAAVGSAGIKHTSSKNSSSLGLIGAGVQGFHQILFACRVRPIKEVYIFDAYNSDLKKFIDRLKVELPNVTFHICKDSEDLCAHSEIIITATNATSPVLPNSKESLQGKHIIAIGSYKPDMIEVPDALFELIDKVYIDVDMALDESGDLIQPINKGILAAENIKLLSSVIAGQEKLNIQETTLFKSVGMALFDLFTAKYLLEKSLKTGIGQEVSF
jgi:ornithine cyclodeaminase